MLNEDVKRQEDERVALEACIPNKVAFSIPEAAKILNMSTRWAREMARGGQLKSVYIGGARRVTRPTLLDALQNGVEK